MMTGEAVQVPWPDLARRTDSYRSSAPTRDAVKSARWTATVERGGKEPLVDTVIMAAFRLALRDPEAFVAEVWRIEAERFPVHGPGGSDPGS